MKFDACSIAPEDWQRIAIKDVCLKVTSGGTPSRKNPEFYANGSIGWVKTKELADGFISTTEETINHDAVANSSAKVLPKDTILLAMYGATVGMLGILSKEMACNQACCAMLTKPEFDRDFLFYQLLAHRSQLQGLATGAAQQNLSGQQIKELIIPFPRLEQQRAIGAYLRILDDRTTLLRETNTTLEAIAQALFKSWFVDFDPVHAKMQGSAPEGMDEATAALFPDSFEESELGAVPTGWRVGVLGDIAKTVKKQLSPADLHAGLHYVGLEHIPRKSLSLVDWDDASGLESAKAAFSKGDVLFGKLRPYFHKVVIAPFDGVCSTDILVCQPTKPRYRGIATQHLFSDELISYADRLSNGAKMPRVNWGDLAAYQVVLPAEAVADAFSKAIDPLIERITHNAHGVKSLESLRDALLPRLISGQLSLTEAATETI